MVRRVQWVIIMYAYGGNKIRGTLIYKDVLNGVEWTLFLCVVITPSANILLPHDCLRCMYVVIRYLYVCSDCLRCLYVVIRYLYVSLACLYNS